MGCQNPQAMPTLYTSLHSTCHRHQLSNYSHNEPPIAKILARTLTTCHRHQASECELLTYTQVIIRYS